MTCKDCINYDKCPTVLSHKSNLTCSMFKHKQEYVHIPCKLGSKAYVLTALNDVDEIKIGIIAVQIETYMNTKRTRIFIGEDSNRLCGWLGETVFLSEEEAFRSLK